MTYINDEEAVEKLDVEFGDVAGHEEAVKAMHIARAFILSIRKADREAIKKWALGRARKFNDDAEEHDKGIPRGYNAALADLITYLDGV